MIMEVISIIIGLCLSVVWFIGDLGFMSVLARVLDVASLVCILALSVPILFKNGLGKDFLRAFKLLRKGYTCHLSELRRTLDVVEMMQKQVICAAAFSAVISIINVLCSLDTLETLGPNLAVAILTIFYAIILEMLLLPLQIEAKRRIIDYISEEEQE